MFDLCQMMQGGSALFAGLMSIVEQHSSLITNKQRKKNCRMLPERQVLQGSQYSPALGVI